METLQTPTLEEVLSHHLQAFGSNNIEEMMKDYDEQSEVWTPNGALRNLESIRSFFNYAFTLVPQGSTQFEITQRLERDDMVYLAWYAESPAASIPLGTDTFVIKNGKILLQTLAAHIIPKS
jgi:hypothetical protein